MYGVAVEQCPVVGQLGLAHVIAGDDEGEGLVVLDAGHLRGTLRCIITRSGYGDADGFVAGDIGLAKHTLTSCQYYGEKHHEFTPHCINSEHIYSFHLFSFFVAIYLNICVQS